jgi:hypothetical protein
VTLQHIIAALRAAPSIRQWQITEVVTVRHERYLTFLAVESERRAAATRWVVWLALAAHDGKQGEASFTLGSAEDADALVERMRQALDAAAAAGNPAWELPVPGAPGTAEAPSDPAAACDSGLLADPVHVLDELVGEYTAAVPAEVRPSTLELFATITDRRLLNHRGLDLRDRSTRLYAEFVLLHRPAHGAEVEFFDRVEATRASDLHLGARGTQVVPAGGTPLAELRSGVLEVVRFSEFSPRADTGAFSGEIRLAYLHLADGTRRAICGGSVSGVLKDALADARFSREVVTVGDYHGPQAIRLAAVTITA